MEPYNYIKEFLENLKIEESKKTEPSRKRREFVRNAIWGIGGVAAGASSPALANHADQCGSESTPHSLGWAQLTGMPSTFTPSAHTHSEYMKHSDASQFARTSHSHSGYASTSHTHSTYVAHSQTGSFSRDGHSHNEYALKSEVGTGSVIGTAAVAAEPNSIAKRDGSGQLTAKKFLGRATSAEWADLAEKYNTDEFYEEGDVLAIGGEKEATIYKKGMPLAGVTSYFPGYELNNNKETYGWNYICLKGRVPVKIKGSANKGDYILADDEGRGIATDKISTIEQMNLLIGIALESGSDVVEVKI